ncbi:hypothetical protein FQA47_024844 [Oryzias melastigma]|uniref:Uncharacterized protein n=1 Tax=Oryzias melastigma TaxID=30732 RepID=A0A834FK93_ORYME|nr:hypothetical protein FQA47_024844 [Oryzias melastigma]
MRLNRQGAPNEMYISSSELVGGGKQKAGGKKEEEKTKNKKAIGRHDLALFVYPEDTCLDPSVRSIRNPNKYLQFPFLRRFGNIIHEDPQTFWSPRVLLWRWRRAHNRTAKRPLLGLELLNPLLRNSEEEMQIEERCADPGET